MARGDVVKRILQWPIRVHLIILVLIAVIPAIGVVFYTGLEEERNALREAHMAALNSAQALSYQQQRMTEGTAQLLQAISYVPDVQNLRLSSCTRLLRSIQKDHPYYKNLLIATAQGKIVASALPFRTHSVADRKYYRDAMSTKAFAAGELVIGRTSRLPSFHFAYPVPDVNGQVKFIIIAAADIGHYSMLFKKSDLPAGSIVVFTDHRGIRLFREPGNGEYTGKQDQPDIMAQMQDPSDKGTFSATGVDGGKRLYGYQRLRLRDGSPPYLYIRAGILEDKALAAPKHTLMRNMVFLIVLSVLALASALILGHYLLARRIDKLVIASHRLAEGETGVQTHLSYDEGELGMLAAAFDKMSTDIEKRRQEESETEKTLRESEAKYRTLFETMTEGVLYQDINGNIISANPAAEMILGLSADSADRDASLSPHRMTLHEDGTDFPESEHPSVIALQTGEPVTNVVMAVFNTREKQYRWIIISAIPLFKAGEDKPFQVYSVFRDITDRRRFQQEKTISENLFLTLFNHMAEGVALHRMIRDEEGRAVDYEIIDVNTGYEVILQLPRDQVIHRSGKEIYGTETAPHLAEYASVLDSGLSYTFEAPFEPMNKYFSISVVSMGDDLFATIFFDITARKKAEESERSMAAQLRQAQKMEAIGTLAGGIAHDFNNILASMIGYTELAMDANEADVLKECLDQVLVACNRAKHLVRQILSFSRQNKREQATFDISIIVKEALNLLRSSLPTTIEICQIMETEPMLVQADSTQIHQVLLNLSTNASHAMREQGGTLTVELGITDVADMTIAKLAGGKYVRLVVSDTGMGIDPSIMDRIFDPFFTTKKSGEGTGLGLSVVYGIVTGFGGAVTVNSEVGKGTTATIYLPLIERETLQAAETNSEDIPTGHEWILIVDDELPLVQLMERILMALGYKTIPTTSSEGALELFRHTPDRYDLVITDMTMPKMTGAALAREILEIRPDIPIILCTGFSEIISEQAAQAIGISKFIMKPMNRQVLAKAVRDALDGKKTRAAF
ncbi:MAG: Sensor histidine kinase RcsC [Syntrophus sp. SKADARSKE-3]|nr:Sensor histidine kinase RcsC [Syntrophus sp. SKADARSKE-3]